MVLDEKEVHIISVTVVKVSRDVDKVLKRFKSLGGDALLCIPLKSPVSSYHTWGLRKTWELKEIH